MSAAEWIAKGREHAGRSQEMRARYPRALDALEAVLALHAPSEWTGGRVYCESCSFEEFEPYPCPTAAAIESALRGES